MLRKENIYTQRGDGLASLMLSLLLSRALSLQSDVPEIEGQKIKNPKLERKPKQNSTTVHSFQKSRAP